MAEGLTEGTLAVIALLFWAVSISHPSSIPGRVDLVEYNHFYDGAGKLAYEQVVLYEWSPDYRRYDVMVWYLVTSIDQVPTKLPSGRWLVDVREKNRRILVTATLFRETWTQVDPEREHKKLMEERLRVNLWREKEGVWR